MEIKTVGDRLQRTLDYGDFADRDLVIEGITEELDLNPGI